MDSYCPGKRNSTVEVTRYKFDYRGDRVPDEMGEWVLWKEIAPYLVVLEYLSAPYTSEELETLKTKIQRLETRLEQAESIVYL